MVGAMLLDMYIVYIHIVVEFAALTILNQCNSEIHKSKASTDRRNSFTPFVVVTSNIWKEILYQTQTIWVLCVYFSIEWNFALKAHILTLPFNLRLWWMRFIRNRYTNCLYAITFFICMRYMCEFLFGVALLQSMQVKCFSSAIFVVNYLFWLFCFWM